MSWVAVPDTAHLDSRFLGVTAAARLAYLTSWLHASIAQSDGFIAAAALPMVSATDVLAAELVDAGLWRPAPGGWTIDGYLSINRTRAEIEALSAKRRDAGRKGGRLNGARRGEASAQALASKFASSPCAGAGAGALDPFSEGERGSKSSTSTSKSEASASPALCARLADIGVDDPSALLAEYGDQLVEAWLAELPHRPDLSNPAGFLVSRLSTGQMPPPRPAPSASPMSRVIAEKAREFVASLPPLDTARAVGE